MSCPVAAPLDYLRDAWPSPTSARTGAGAPPSPLASACVGGCTAPCPSPVSHCPSLGAEPTARDLDRVVHSPSPQMPKPPQEPDLNLRDFLSARARTASDLRLVLDTGLGLLAAMVALLWRPAGWKLVTSAALCFVAFGGWGIADRELQEREHDPGNSRISLRLLRLARLFAATLGAAAAVAFLVEVLAIALGTWIS